jgi:uncharacterized protein DUF1707
MANGQDVAMRASDSERDEVATALARACSDGRLSPEELEARVQRAYAATHRSELDALLADLPKSARRADPPAGGKRRFYPGVRHFSERADVAATRERAFDNALSSLVPGLGRAGYRLVSSERPMVIRLERPPSGLVARLLGNPKPLTMVFTQGPEGGTRITSFGEAPRSIRRAFAELGG